MNLENLKTLSEELQKAFDAKDLETVLGYYHPDIVLGDRSSIRQPSENVGGFERYKRISHNG
jgi:ketosteroid isomerase-like protein